MKKTYTKKQIQEALNYWRAQLKLVSESEVNSSTGAEVQQGELGDSRNGESLQPMSRDEADSRADAELKKQASALGLADGEVVGLLLGKLCIINASKNEVRALTPEQYSKFCEMSGTCTLANESKKEDKKEDAKKDCKESKKEDKKWELANESSKKEESKPAKKQHTREEIMEAISHWRGVLESMEDEAEKQDAGRKEELDAFADMVYSFIKNAV